MGLSAANALQMNLQSVSRPGLHVRCSCSRPVSSRTSRCLASSRSDNGNIPVVNDATVLPPPPTGSQYAWRRSWAGSGTASSSGGGANGGTGGRSQAQTRDWGGGPNSSILFFLMYRIRMLLLYGAWVTVLYGALRAVCDLSAKVGRGVMATAVHASSWAASGLHTHNGSSSASREPGTAAGSSSTSGSSDAAEGNSAAAAAAAALAATSAPGENGGAGSTAAVTAADTDSTKELSGPAGSCRDSSSSSTGGGDGSSRFASISARLQERPTARLFTDLMACVIPLYLMLMGSVVFFASV